MGNICTREQNTLFSKLRISLLAGNNPGLVLANLCLGMPGQCQELFCKFSKVSTFQPLCGDLALCDCKQWVCVVD